MLPLLSLQIFAILWTPVHALTYFRYSVLITLSDLQPGSIIDSGFSGEAYRVYGTYSSAAISSDFTQNIFVRGNTTVSLFQLAQANSANPYANPYLTPVIMSSPIQVVDNNTSNTTRFPFTIYIVTIDKRLQVLDARSAKGEIVSEDTIAFGGVTILSAESYYNLHSFKLKDYTSLQFSTCGFDSKLIEYVIMKIEYTEYGPGSFLTVTSPILTLYTETYRVFASFNYTIDKEPNSGTRNLKSISNTAVMSPGWINSSQSFPTDSMAPFQNMSFRFNESRALIIKVSASGLQPGEHLFLQAGTSDDQTYNSWSVGNLGEGIYQRYGTNVKITLNTISPNNRPNFLVQITSDAHISSGCSHLLLIVYLLLVR